MVPTARAFQANGSMNMRVTYKVGPRKQADEEARTRTLPFLLKDALFQQLANILLNLEQVQDIPRPLLVMVLKAVLGSADAQARGNLQPLSMAQATPRVFWNVVRHGGIGPHRGFQAALSELVPDPEWASVWANLDVRQRKMSARAAAAEANRVAMEELD